MASRAKFEHEIAAFTRRTKAEKFAEEKLGFVAVALIGYARAVPIEFTASNQGIWPCRIVATKSPRDVHKKPDTESPVVAIKLWAYVWTRSEFHAKRLKDRMEALLLGETENAPALRHSWIDVEAPEITWGLLLPKAIAQIQQRERFETWNEMEYRALVQRAVSRGLQ